MARDPTLHSDRGKKHGHGDSTPSSPWVRRFAARLPKGETVLDLACGGGRHTRLLLARGHPVLALDRDVSGLADLAGRPSLGRMVRHLLGRVPALRRLRLTSLDPAAMDDDLFRLLAEEPRFMPHLHLSLQAGDDVVLKRMKRRHTRADAIEVCRRAREARGDVVFGADLIAGFPTETEPMFGNTLSAVAEMGLTYLHVFPYSPRPGTPAARMPEVPVTVRKERAAMLRAAGEKALARFLESRVGTIAEVLVEKGRSGRCRHYAPVHLGFDAPAGAVVGARIANVVEGRLVGNRAA